MVLVLIIYLRNFCLHMNWVKTPQRHIPAINDNVHERVMDGLNVFYTDIDVLPNKMCVLLQVEDDKQDIIVLTD